MFEVYLSELYTKIYNTKFGDYPIIISAMPDEYGSVGTVCGSIMGDPSRGIFIYRKSAKTLVLIDSWGKPRRYHKHEFLEMPELEDLEVGFYYWFIRQDDEIHKYPPVKVDVNKDV